MVLVVTRVVKAVTTVMVAGTVMDLVEVATAQEREVKQVGEMMELEMEASREVEKREKEEAEAP